MLKDKGKNGGWSGIRTPDSFGVKKDATGQGVDLPPKEQESERLGTPRIQGGEVQPGSSNRRTLRTTDPTDLQRRARRLLAASRQVQRKMPVSPALLAAHRALVRASLDQALGAPDDLVGALREEARAQAAQGERRYASRLRRRAGLLALDGAPRPVDHAALYRAIEDLETCLAGALWQDAAE